MSGMSSSATFFGRSEYHRRLTFLIFSYPMSWVTFWSWALILDPCLWVALLWATSVMALMAAISGFRCVPTPIVNISGSFVRTSSAAAPMVVTPRSVVRSLRCISMP